MLDRVITSLNADDTDCSDDNDNDGKLIIDNVEDVEEVKCGRCWRDEDASEIEDDVEADADLEAIDDIVEDSPNAEGDNPIANSADYEKDLDAGYTCW